MDTIQREALNQPLRWPRWVPLLARWSALALAAFGLAMLWLIAVVRPPRDHFPLLVFSLIVSGGISLVGGVMALRLVDAVRLDSVRLKIAIPAILAVVVIALNALIAARLMFISVMDSEMLLVYLAFGICLALMVSGTVASKMAMGLRRLTMGAQRIANGEYSERLPDDRLGGIAELTQLVQSFNRMATSVQEAFRSRDTAEAHRRQMMAALSHDVRTPLTSMRAMVEAIDDGVVSDPAVIQRYHRALRGEMRHLSALIDDLFEVSRLEAGTVPLNRISLNIEDVLSDALEASHEQAERDGITLIGKVEDDLPLVWADARHIHRVVMNLIQNSLRYTPSGGLIVLHAGRADQTIRVQVIDTGEGITPEDLPHIFVPAYRGDSARKRFTATSNTVIPGGTGLGLAIAHGLIEAHGGEIHAASPLPSETIDLMCQIAPDVPTQPHVGAVVTFSLPLRRGSLPHPVP